jgi:hypothetical protein
MISTKYSPILVFIMIFGNIKVLNACAKVEEGFTNESFCKVGSGNIVAMVQCSSLTSAPVGCYVSTNLVSLTDII